MPNPNSSNSRETTKSKKLVDIQQQLDKVRLEIQQNNLPLSETATNMVFGKGNPLSDIFIIGEAPGEKEDLSGLPFVGRAGKELDSLLQTIGLTLEQCYIANILKYRPPKNRNPNTHEIQTHTPFLLKQIQIIKPKIILTLGTFATQFILAQTDISQMKKVPAISKIHGQLHTVQIKTLRLSVIPLYHPAAFLYRPRLRIDAVSDMQKVLEYLEKNET